MTFRKPFIAYDLPLAEISEQSAREKNIRHGHPPTLHIWSANRPPFFARLTSLTVQIEDWT
jgi:adenine-specific DNA methylase